MIRAAIFDLDDTLLDTRALFDAREAREWSVVLGGLDSVEAFEVADGEPAVTSLPKEAQDRGLAVGLFTHSPQNYAEGILRRHGITVDQMVTGTDRLPLKPDPTGLLTVARALGIDPSACLYVGDSVGDFGAAAAAGMASVGVSWEARTPESWRHGWPDVAVDRPSRFLSLLDGATGLGPLAEVVVDDQDPISHWGSILRLGSNTFGLGRYFPMGDHRYPGQALSHLIIDSKDDPDQRERLAEAFASMGKMRLKNPPQLIASVPPSPDGEDRFAASRVNLAELYEAEDGEGVLEQIYGVDDYKFTHRDERPAKVIDRFQATKTLDGERMILIDDVINTGSQANACRTALLDAGAGSVMILAASVNQDALPKPCPSCGEGYGGTVRTKRRRRDGKEFLGCSRFRQGCRWSEDLP
jgi:HAD superfamily hydrolase (TIGR01549 family)